MNIFHPNFMFDKIWHINIDFLKQNHIQALILDVDNTLTTHGNPDVDERVTKWIKLMKDNNIKLIILSNNTDHRVRPFAESLGLNFVANGKKPLTSGITRACMQLEVNCKNTALIGDQIFTDILGGNLKRITTILVHPISFENEGRGIEFKRKIEKPFIRRSIKKTGGYKKHED